MRGTTRNTAVNEDTRNSMKQKLAAGELVLCMNLRLARTVDIAMVAKACREHGKVLGVGGIRHNVALQGELIRLGARFVIAGTDVNYVLAGARQDTAALRAIPLG